MSTAKTQAGRSALPKDPLMKEAAAFRRRLPRLLRTYEGEYVALYQGRVAGHGSDDEELAGRMYQELGDVPFYIARVEEAPVVCDIPSPEVVGG